MNSQISFLLKTSTQALRESRIDTATLFLKQAIKIEPNNPKILRLLGIAAVMQGEYSSALIYINKAIQHAPKDSVLYSNLGSVLHEMKNYDGALAAYDESIKLMANYEEAWSNKGNLLRDLRRYEEALICHDKALSLKPNYAEAWNNKGNVLSDLESYEEAITNYKKAIEFRPNYAEAWSNTGDALRNLKKYEEALFCHNQALAIGENQHHLLSKGLTLQELGRGGKAIEQYNRALQLNPSYAEAYANKGLALHELGQYEEAIKQYDVALNLKPSLHEVWKNKGVTYHDLSRYSDAIACYKASLELNPESYEASWNLSLTLLLQGDLKNGLPLYENRWKSKKISSATDHRFKEMTKWTGKQELENKTILIYGEQGYGDFIQFSRYIKELGKKGAKVILEVPEPLFELMQSYSDIAQIILKGKDLPSFDYCCPVMSLPLVTGECLTNKKFIDPYLFSDKDKVAEWKLMLGKKQKKRIGLAWSSFSEFKDDSTRSISLSQLLDGLPKEGFEYICLQKELKATDRETLNNHGGIKFFGDRLNNFSDTAALIESMDLVISTCTSVPHLSAAIGKETWLLLKYTPDWRWFLDRDDSPWYPSIKLLRQTKIGDWNGVLKTLKIKLENLNKQ